MCLGWSGVSVDDRFTPLDCGCQADVPTDLPRPNGIANRWLSLIMVPNYVVPNYVTNYRH